MNQSRTKVIIQNPPPWSNPFWLLWCLALFQCIHLFTAPAFDGIKIRPFPTDEAQNWLNLWTCVDNAWVQTSEKGICSPNVLNEWFTAEWMHQGYYRTQILMFYNIVCFCRCKADCFTLWFPCDGFVTDQTTVHVLKLLYLKQETII